MSHGRRMHGGFEPAPSRGFAGTLAEMRLQTDTDPQVRRVKLPIHAIPLPRQWDGPRVQDVDEAEAERVAGTLAKGASLKRQEADKLLLMLKGAGWIPLRNLRAKGFWNSVWRLVDMLLGDGHSIDKKCDKETDGRVHVRLND